MMQQLLEGAFRSLLNSQGLVIPQQGFTLEHVTPTEDRMDAQLSHILQNIASCNIVTAAIFTVARPIVDTTITNGLKAIGASKVKANRTGADVKAKASGKAEEEAKVVGHVFLDKMESSNTESLTRKRTKSKGKSKRSSSRAKHQIIDAEFVLIPRGGKC